MIREELLKQLKTVAPALSNNNLIPVLTHLWFDGERVMAYNDQIAISTPCATSFKGAVPGSLLDILNAMKHKQVDITADGDTVTVKAGSSRIKLGLLPPEQFLFEMPPPPDNGLPLATRNLEEALECCMMSVASDDTSIPDHLGITIIPENKALVLYATNGFTMSRAKLAIKNPPQIRRSILSRRFVEQLLRLTGKDSSGNLLIMDDHCVAKIGETTLFGRLIEGGSLTFERTYALHVPEDATERLYQIPSALRMILERAIIITNTSVEETSTQVTVQNSTDGRRKMIFKSASQHGEIIDRLAVSENQPSINTFFRAKLLKSALRGNFVKFDRMLVTDHSIVMTKDQFSFLVAATKD